MKYTYFLLAFFLISSFSIAQDQNYDVEFFNEAYVELSDDIELTDPMDPWDDPELKVPLGFPLTLFDMTSDTLVTLESLGGILFSKSFFNSIAFSIYYYAADLMDPADIGLEHSPISYVLEGGIGNQIFKLQIKNAGFFQEIDEFSTANNIINVQLWIYEADRTIEIHYGPSNIPDPELVFGDYGENGPLTGIGVIEDYEVGFLETVNDINDPPTLDSVNLASYELKSLGLSLPDSSLVIRLFDRAVGTKSPIALTGVQLYPSVVSDLIILDIDNPEIISKPATIRIYDNMGRGFYTNTIQFSSKHEMPVNRLHPGKYFLQLTTESGFKTFPFVKQ